MVGIALATVLVVVLSSCLLWFCWTRNSLSQDVRRFGTSSVKRKYPPGTIPGQQLDEITLVQSDIEGSTELWEW